MSETLVHKGSTKDVYRFGENYLFRFSDRYSVFDWGEMPDHLDGKGMALARFTKAIYKKLSEVGIKHHLLDIPAEANEIIVKPFEVVRDGSSLLKKENVFIPLEVIFRMGVAKGSSLLKRMNCEEDWKQAGFSRAYQELDMFDQPMIEFTTKLERFDRPLTAMEAKELSGLNEKEWADLLSVTTKIAETLKAIFGKHDITLWDGKVELALGTFSGGKREVVLVDSIGPDELRLTKNNVQLSKEIIRQYYRKTEWYGRLEEAKNKHGIQFKEYITPPAALPKDFKNSVEELYCSLADVVSNDSEVSLQKVVTKLRNSL